MAIKEQGIILSISKKEYNRKWNRENKDKRKIYKKNYQEAHPEEFKLRKRNESLKKKYGITQVEYDVILIRQNYCCAICGRNQDNFKRQLAVDHIHVAGYDELPIKEKPKYIRGLLCYTCNRQVGILENIFDLQKMIRYLDNYIVPDHTLDYTP